MPCDWAVALLEEAVCDAGLGYDVRRHAIRKLQELLRTAVHKGYEGVSPVMCERWARTADRDLTRQCIEGGDEGPAVEALCSHLSQAVADGYLGSLPDF